MQAIILGDLQVTPAVLLADPWLGHAGFTLLSKDSGPTCFVGSPSAIDHCVVSTPLARTMAAPVVVESVRCAHMGLLVRVPRRPRALHGYAFPQVRSFPLEREYLEPRDDEGRRLPPRCLPYDEVVWEDAWAAAAAHHAVPEGCVCMRSPCR